MAAYTKRDVSDDVEDMAPGFDLSRGIVIGGSATLRLDAARIPPGVEHALEGVELIASGAPNTDDEDAEMLPGWWGG